VRKLYNKCKFDVPVRSILILFYLETYIDLYIGGLINTENDFLFEVAANWGPNGYLSFSDQFTVLLGNLFYVTCSVFPFLAVYILHKKSRAPFMAKSEEGSFDEMYECLYEDLRTTNTGIFHYYFVFLMRRMIYCHFAYWYYEPVYTATQVFVNLLLSFYFACYLIAFKPFFDNGYNTLQVINEISYLVTSYHLITFTDF